MSIVPGGEGAAGEAGERIWCSSHSLLCFLDFDFFGFLIRWYFRASSLSGAAAFRVGDGRLLERQSRKRHQWPPALFSLEGGSLWWQRGHFNLHLVCHREGKDGDKHSRVDTKSTLSCSQLEVNVASYLLGYYYCFLHTTSPAFQGNPIQRGPSFSWQSSFSCPYHQNYFDQTRQRL